MGMERSVALLALLLASCSSNPLSKPYIAYRTSPFEQGDTLDHKITWDDSSSVREHRSQIRPHDAVSATECPLQFSLGISKRLHAGHDGAGDAIRNPPIIHPVFPARGSGRQVVYNTQYEHLDLLSPAPLETSGEAIKEALLQAPDFPLLLESSSFLTSPILHDINGDGITDAILSDYDGGIYVVGLAGSPRYFHHAQVPRMYMRREWLSRRVNETLYPDQELEKESERNDPGSDTIHDPYHSYFEYYYVKADDKNKVIRGKTANLLDQDHEQVKALTERRGRRVKHDLSEKADPEDPLLELEATTEDEETEATSGDEGSETTSEVEETPPEDPLEESQHRRLQEVTEEDTGNVSETPDEAATVEHEGANQATEELRAQEEAPKQDTEVKNAIEEPDGKEGVDVTEEGYSEEFHAEPVENRDVPASKDEEVDVEPVLDLDAEHVQDLDAPAVTEKEPSVESASEEHNIPKEEEKEANADPVEEHTVDEKVQVGVSDQGDAAEASEAVEDQVLHEGTDAVVERSLEEPTSEDSEDNADSEERDEREPYNDDPDMYSDMAGDDYAMDDPGYGRGGTDDEYGSYGDYDDMYGHDPRHDSYYDDKHYIRVPPHILCTPVLGELPKIYGDKGDNDDILFVAVSYYLDEDEYQGFFSYKRFEETDHGDETEVKRGSYVSNAIMAYTFGDSARWSGQTHLDLSTDFSAPENVTIVGALPIHADVSNMGAFALGSPTIADLDGDGSFEVLMGTSMGIVYAFDARQMFARKNWPIQMENPIESRIIVEDAAGDTNLEVFISDIGGNVVCFSHEANRLWHRDLRTSLGEAGNRITGSSDMVLGDVDGDGVLDVVIVVRTKVATHDDRAFVFALNAATGKDVPNFPIELTDPVKLKKSSDDLHQKLAQPLLVDLHVDQSFLNDYIRRNGTEWKKRTARKSSSPPHGGSSPGLHIVQPLGEQLYIIEAGSGCSQKVSIGAEVSSMVAVDDVHGTNKLDLVVVTDEGKTITLESASPYHPLNTWNHGEVRGRMNAHAHGYSASQGIFVHEVSRQYLDIFGVYVPITFEIFDNRPNIQNEPDRRKYAVDIRDGTSSKRVLWRKEYSQPGVYTERVFIRYGPGYYALSVVMKTSHGLLYEDTFHMGYNVHFMDGFGSLLVVPLLVAAITILLCGAKKPSWDDEEVDGDRESNGRGILDQELPS